MQEQNDRTGNKDRDREEEQQTLVSLHLDAEDGQVSDNRPGHDS